MSARNAFAASAAQFRSTVGDIGALGPAVLDERGTDDWTVRELLAHTCRAFLTIKGVLGAPDDGSPVLPDAVAYFKAALGASPTIGADIVARGKATVAELGDDPIAGALAIADAGCALVDATPDDAPVSHFSGRLRFIDYLPTRVVELVLHTVDLQRATGLAVAAAPEGVAVVRDALVGLAATTEGDQALELCLALTGRSSGFGLLP